jgi:hypothetical protein
MRRMYTDNVDITEAGVPVFRLRLFECMRAWRHYRTSRVTAKHETVIVSSL